ncbi:hypothetical protein LCGC14_1707720 [marine sediment metagenome]|uniref:Uncharacterized protein n=1 Tax=marine sediment metagenome TaxID=412755 RepID=A0A0F9JWI4_9ZZZZ
MTFTPAFWVAIGFGVVGLVAAVLVLCLSVYFLRHQDDTLTRLRRISKRLEQGESETEVGTQRIGDINASIRAHFERGRKG